METYDVHITTENRDGKKQDQMAVMSQEQMDSAILRAIYAGMKITVEKAFLIGPSGHLLFNIHLTENSIEMRKD